MKGTTPLVDLGEDFRNRLLEIDPELDDFNYAAEAYDAVMVITLAAQIANTDGSQLAAEINGVTRDGEKCTTYQQCLQRVDAGGNIDYDGVSGPLEFNGVGEPTVASFGVLQFADDNRIDEAATEYEVAQAPEDQAALPAKPLMATREGDGVLKFGSLLPETGSLAFLGPPEFAGVELAVQEVNENGGYNGQDVQVSQGDSGDTTTDIANQTTDRLLSENVDAIVGAASSGVTLTVIDKITSAGVIEFSPANTSPDLSTYEDKGLYFRDAPSDVLQGNVLGQIIVNDGNQSVGILVLDDPYGVPLSEQLTTSIQESGGEVVESITYDPSAQTFDAEVERIAAADPDAIAVIGFEESSRILTTMIEKGVGPADKAVYGVDGNMGNALGEDFEAGD
jgi:ABC-type branched-subunit amino acid transport system substrate-binding protein